MKRIYHLLGSVLLTFLTACTMEIHAENLSIQHWAILTMGADEAEPTVAEYSGVPEKNSKGVFYQRIIKGYAGDKLPYGYRISGNDIYIYDFENDKETTAFDFNLKEGGKFTTFNGMEWEVVSVKDTLVTTFESFWKIGEPVSKRLLNVQTLDGKYTDQWLEGFGSLTNHFMINGIEDTKYSQTLFMEYDEDGTCIARDINADPFFTHDTGWMGKEREWKEAESRPLTSCYFKDGKVMFEDIKLCWEYRRYSCFYRKGDEIRRIFSRELKPIIDGGNYGYKKDCITFAGLPAPSSGEYRIHIDEQEYSTGISPINREAQTVSGEYDLQGRRLPAQPSAGIYVKKGKKVLGK